MLISLFLVSFSSTFLFIPCGRLSWLSVSFYCTLNTRYRIVSYRIVTVHLCQTNHIQTKERSLNKWEVFNLKSELLVVSHFGPRIASMVSDIVRKPLSSWVQFVRKLVRSRELDLWPFGLTLYCCMNWGNILTKRELAATFHFWITSHSLTELDLSSWPWPLTFWLWNCTYSRVF